MGFKIAMPLSPSCGQCIDLIDGQGDDFQIGHRRQQGHVRQFVAPKVEVDHFGEGLEARLGQHQRGAQHVQKKEKLFEI